MKKVEEEIKSYFEPKEIPPINEEKIKELQMETLKNKRKKSFWYSFKKYGFAAACLLMIVVSAILIPTIARKEEKFYADNVNTNNQELTVEYASSYINENYSKYNFVFEEYNIFKIIGIYTGDTNDLLAIRMEGEKNDVPFTSLNLCLVVNVNFTPKERIAYLDGAQEEKKEEYTLHSKEVSDFLETEIYRVLDCNKYSIYIKVNCSDFKAVEKFL